MFSGYFYISDIIENRDALMSIIVIIITITQAYYYHMYTYLMIYCHCMTKSLVNANRYGDVLLQVGAHCGQTEGESS